jgi:cyclopropane-fatty-acyl-phospholipid synthase
MRRNETSLLSIPILSRGRSRLREERSAARGLGLGSASFIETWLLNQIMRLAGDPRIRIVLWDDRVHYCPPVDAVGAVRFADRLTLWRFFLNPSLGFGDGFSSGLIEIDGSLCEVIEAIFSAQMGGSESRGRLQEFVNRGLVRQRRNTLSGSRRNIHDHYDLGNDFYRLWLDEEMAYTCAYFPARGMTLEAAQKAKMDHVCRKLRLRPGEHVVEAGCGWGGLARHMARHYGAEVRAYNISHQQILYARQRARVEGLADRIEYIEDDYRAITGTADVFVSVGMLEHVGAENYRALGQVIDRTLTESGRGLIHSIGKLQSQPTGAWTEKRLFPGGYTPTLREMMDVFEGPGLSVLDVENLRLHYAETVQHWLARYEANIDQVRQQFDPFFERAWRLYLTGCIAAFRSGGLQLYQVLFTRPTFNELHRTRADIYATGVQDHDRFETA